MGSPSRHTGFDTEPRQRITTKRFITNVSWQQCGAGTLSWISGSDRAFGHRPGFSVFPFRFHHQVASLSFPSRTVSVTWRGTRTHQALTSCPRYGAVTYAISASEAVVALWSTVSEVQSLTAQLPQSFVARIPSLTGIQVEPVILKGDAGERSRVVYLPAVAKHVATTACSATGRGGQSSGKLRMRLTARTDWVALSAQASLTSSVGHRVSIGW